ncbi:MAG TPA: NAD(P)-dependent oxidoreductase [Erysipelothrix sp.]|nr:NAD(P)-dependent oxidoreductase [Erysipelothrix sp.]
MNLSATQTVMPTRDDLSFQETNCGYSLTDAQLEADRCLQCKHQPCVTACPIHVPIPQFIKKIGENDLEAAYDIITSRSNFPNFCSRVCHVEHQCQGSCVRAIKGESVAINHLERFVSDHMSQKRLIKQASIDKKIAVIGSGPSGLACASDLAQLGYQVDIYEKEAYAGGIVSYGVPEYRLPHRWVYLEIEKIKELGVHFFYNSILGNNINLDVLKENYDAIYIAIGEEKMVPLNVPGENLPHVYNSFNYLKKVFENKIDDLLDFKKVIVIGGGNTAMDCARCAKRFGADVTIVYRRLYEDMPASASEIQEASKEGINFEFLASPVEIREDSIILTKREVISTDKQGRNKTVEIPNSNYSIEADAIILALGSKPDMRLRNKLGIQTDPKGRVLINDDYQTSISNIYSGGDMVRGADTVVRAIDAGKKAAKNIHEKILEPH